jgi:LPS export ABC transporter protein LptC/lipopolysaccharide transport protein LptA
MKGRTTIVYIASGFVAASFFMAGYFFLKKPEKVAPPVSAEGQTAIVFKDVTYSGEKKGVIDWEIRARIARKFIDRPRVEMEEIEGEYKPKKDTTIIFRGSKGFLNTEREKGSIQDVEIIQNKEYTLTSEYMDFDFKKGLTTTSAPVHIEGSRLTLNGIGLVANTNDEVIKLEKDVTGFVVTKKGKYVFSSDTFTYYMKEHQYILDGRATMKGADLDVQCSKLFIYGDGEDLEKVDARGKVRLVSKGSVAKSEQAVYHFKEDRAVLSDSPKVMKDSVDMSGKTITFKPSEGKLTVDQPKVRIEKR